MLLQFKNCSQLKAGLSERSDGSMVWWNRLPVDEVVRGNRDSYFRRLGISPERVVAGGIAHGTNVTVITEQGAGKYLLNTDALITNVLNLFLTVTVADCLPVYFYDSVRQAAGLAHAGWRSLTSGILENVVVVLGNEYGSKPAGLQIIIGPHIRACHYEIGAEVAARFAEQNIEHRDGRLFANLAGEAVIRLEKMGVKQISVSPICAYEDVRFFSARRDKSEPLEGMMAYIGLEVKNFFVIPANAGIQN